MASPTSASLRRARRPQGSLRVDVDALNPRCESMRNVGKEQYSSLIVRVDDAILERVPLAKP